MLQYNKMIFTIIHTVAILRWDHLCETSPTMLRAREAKECLGPINTSKSISLCHYDDLVLQYDEVPAKEIIYG